MSAMGNLSYHPPLVEREALGRAPQGPSGSDAHKICCLQLHVVARAGQGLGTASEILSVVPSCERITSSFTTTSMDMALQALVESSLRLCQSVPRSYVPSLC